MGERVEQQKHYQKSMFEETGAIGGWSRVEE